MGFFLTTSTCTHSDYREQLQFEKEKRSKSHDGLNAFLPLLSVHFYNIENSYSI